MNAPTPLTAEQLREYDEKGFVTLAPSFSADELSALRMAADDLLRNSGPLVRGNPRLELEQEERDGEPVIRKIEPVIDLVPALEQLVYDPRMTAASSQLFGEEAILFEDKVNYKPALVGTAYPLHQDYAYWSEYTDRLISVVLHLDDATVENGCLRMMPGRHKEGLLPRPDGETRIIAKDVEDPSIAEDVTDAAGSVVLFRCYTPHHSFPNRSAHGRRAILYTYNPASEGDTYPLYKGQHTRTCLDWLATQA